MLLLLLNVKEKAVYSVANKRGREGEIIYGIKWNSGKFPGCRNITKNIHQSRSELS